MTKTTRQTRCRAPKQARSDVLALELRKREREVIAEYLEKHRGHVGETAEALGLTRRALEHKMEAYDLRDEAAKARVEAGIGGPRTL
jgi:DNA-binding NtrC family response regulator